MGAVGKAVWFKAPAEFKLAGMVQCKSMGGRRARGDVSTWSTKDELLFSVGRSEAALEGWRSTEDLGRGCTSRGESLSAVVGTGQPKKRESPSLFPKVWESMGGGGFWFLKSINEAKRGDESQELTPESPPPPETPLGERWSTGAT